MLRYAVFRALREDQVTILDLRFSSTCGKWN